jgi:hypothetical protein
MNLCRFLGGTLNLIIIEPFEDFRRTAEGVEVLFIEAIVMLMEKVCWGLRSHERLVRFEGRRSKAFSGSACSPVWVTSLRCRVYPR